MHDEEQRCAEQRRSHVREALAEASMELATVTAFAAEQLELDRDSQPASTSLTIGFSSLVWDETSNATNAAVNQIDSRWS